MDSGITNRIFLYLHEHHLTQAELSRVLGVKPPTVNEWKLGKSFPSPRLILKFLFHFNDIDTNWLIHGKVSEKGSQTATGNYNVQAGGKAVVNEPTHLQTENKHLKALIKEKEEQIKLLRELLKK